MVMGDENRHRELHGQYLHPTPTTHSPRVSMQSPRVSIPRIYIGNHILLRWNKQSFFFFFLLINTFLFSLGSHEDYSLGLCGYILLFLSYVLICLTFPFSLTVCLKVEWLILFLSNLMTFFFVYRLFKNMNELLCFDSVVFLVVPKYRYFDMYIISIWSL